MDQPARRDLKKTVSRMSFGMLLFIIVQQFLGAAVGTAVVSVFGSGEWATNTVSFVFNYGICLPLLALYYRLCVPKDPVAPPPKRRMGPGGYVVAVVVAIGLSSVLDMIFNPLLNGLAGLFGSEAGNFVQEEANRTSWLVMLLFFCLQPAIFEELTTRFLPRTRMHGAGDLIYPLYSGFLFMAMHANFGQISPFAMGVVSAFVFAQTGNILYAMGIHFLNNFMLFIFTLVQRNYGIDLNTPISWLFAVAALVLVIVFRKKIAALIRPPSEPGWGKSAPLPEGEGTRPKSAWAVVLLNPGTIALLIVWLLIGTMLFLMPILFPGV